MPVVFDEIFEYFSAVFDLFTNYIMNRNYKFLYFILPFLFCILATLIVEVFRFLIGQVKK